MKSCIFVLATLLFASSTTARPAWNQNGPTKCPESSSAVPFSRLFNSNIEDFLLTNNPAERSRALKRGYEFDGVVARVFRTHQPSTVPLYHHERDLALARDTTNVDNGVAAYVFPHRLCGSEPLYRLLNRGTGEYFYTMDVEERDYAVSDQGYDAAEIAGFALTKAGDRVSR
ncbi:hypothetical protein C8R46DRAFT_1206132 [Mycena filopes]|nr:hypothetical protein C8R46DRAFT_1206132 [Mycena filopes]